MSSYDVETSILDITLQDGPVDLQPAAFGLTSACTDGTVLGPTIDSKVMKLSYQTVCKTLFNELCPDYTDQPHAALDLIKQVSIDSNGNSVSALIYAYHTRLMNAARPLLLTGFTQSVYAPSLWRAWTHASYRDSEGTFPNIAPS